MKWVVFWLVLAVFCLPVWADMTAEQVLGELICLNPGDGVYEPGLVQAGGFGQSAACHIDAMCHPEHIDYFKGVGLFKGGATMYFINTTAPDDSVRFIVKYHCLKAVIGEVYNFEVALNWRITSCQSMDFPPEKQVFNFTARADAVSEQADRVLLTLLKVESDFGQPVEITLLGWNKRELTKGEQGMIMLGYPMGDIQKIVLPRVYANNPEWDRVTVEVGYGKGAIEPGFSGAPLIEDGMVLADLSKAMMHGCPKFEWGIQAYGELNKLSKHWQVFGPFLDNANLGVDSLTSRKVILKPEKIEGLFSFVAKLTDSAPYNFSLSQNYPNPFNPTTTIVYELPKSTQVKVAIYNINGQLIKTIINGWQEAGEYRVTFDGTNFPAGIYFLNLQAGEFKKTIKMNLLK